MIVQHVQNAAQNQIALLSDRQVVKSFCNLLVVNYQVMFVNHEHIVFTEIADCCTELI